MRSKITQIAVPAVLAALLLTSVVVGGCGKSSKKESGKSTTVTDLAGRTVELKVPVKKVVGIGPGALRLICYTGDASKVVGIENIENQMSTGRPYIMANPDLLKLPVIGQGGPDSTPDPEMLMNVEPDVIFVAYLVDKAKADELQSRTGIPVVVLSYGQLGTFDKEILDSIELIGSITGSEERAEEVVKYLKDCENDLEKRTADIPEKDKPSVYAGGLGMKGTQGIESTSGKFPPFTSVNAKNVVDETGKGGSVMIDKEKLLEWDPDYIFIDGSGMPLVKDDYATNPSFYNSLSAVKNGKIFVYPPYNYYTTNVDTALADAYFFGATIFPDAFKGIDPIEKADDIYMFLLGEKLYEQMANDFGGFRQVSLKDG